ncbi:HAMP domain-containing histidine kinase [Gracilibacillus caseinilyticus]|uniref:histidine kinase n=1 Tax=Gracilibacillus caseinilyticus TaxID=2932256 RepID=A0ABY4EYZ3_9BACI|nr:HAMP domain-containing sensor histidine kinase [Gracilibacillus caseinilyticus]UOQ49083.1 HAMP domain-containing histidine kinase [Gracilibacillus caseinilyticus]
MLRNREIQRFVLTQTIICLSSTVLMAIFVSLQAALFLLIVTALVFIVSLYFTKERYREIEKLSSYLRKISSGDYKLDIRDNHEGELSILKNDIYKVTLMLSEQSSYLQQEKIRLTDAISDISHQLKTPLTSMMVMADLLSDPNLNEAKREEFTRNIRVQLERIEWLVSSLLKLSKIDAGTVLFKKDTIYVQELVKKASESVLIPMDIKQQTLKISGDEAVTFAGDFNWTAEALINILKNCVENTDEGGDISISISENALFTEIIIDDTGKGIPKADLPYIFKRFYKGKNAGEDSIGIGLALSYSIITNQQGDIEVKSEIDKGTTFQIKFYKQVI